jgi:hypothetical protein
MKHPGVQLAKLQIAPVAQLFPFATAVHVVVLVAGWQL